MNLLSLFGIFSVSAATVAQAETAAPPATKPLPSKCVCAQKIMENAGEILVVVEGVVVDAQMTLSQDGRLANDRMATIFNLQQDSAIRGRTPIWHNVDPDNCGVRFDYGRSYKLIVRKLENGVLETDFCLLERRSSNNE